MDVMGDVIPSLSLFLCALARLGMLTCFMRLSKRAPFMPYSHAYLMRTYTSPQHSLLLCQFPLCEVGNRPVMILSASVFVLVTAH